MNLSNTPLIIFLVIISSAVTTSFSQSSVVSSGGELSGTGGSASFSAGIVAYTYESGSGGSVTQGVQHTYVIESVGLNEIESLIVKAYPNPTTDVLTLETQGAFSYTVTDSKGAVLFKSKGMDEEEIDLSNLARANYFIYVESKDKKSKTFKIIKQ